jgi:2-dehydropantoate 2-reductase
MNYVFYGAGAIGGSIAARLALNLNQDQITLIARGAHYEQIQQFGLHYQSPSEENQLGLNCVKHPAEITWRPDHVVFLTMKSQDTRAALIELSRTAPADIAVICCQNGVHNEAEAVRFFKNVYAMVVLLPATHLSAGSVIHTAEHPGGILDLGHFPTGTDTTCQQIASDLQAAGFLCTPDPQVMRWKYTKLLQNLGNALQVLLGVDAHYGDLPKRLKLEALSCFQAAGIDSVSREETKKHFRQVIMLAGNGASRVGGSTWQGVERGNNTVETPFLNGEISYLGRTQGIATPVNDTMTRLVNKMLSNNQPAGSYSLDDLEASINQAP